MALTATPGVVAVHGGNATLPNSPAAVTDGSVASMETGSVAFTLMETATGSEVLVAMLVGANGGTITSIRIAGADGTRSPQALSFTDSVGNTTCVANVYRLADGDSSVTIYGTPGVGRLLCWAVIDDTNLVPTDWELFDRSRTAGNTPRTGFWDALDTGVVIGVAAIYGGSVDIGEPYQWTLIAEWIDDTISANFAYSDVYVAGTQAPDAFTGEIPTALTGDVYWFGAYDIGLRLRDGGSWWNGGGIALTAPGPSEPAARQFPPPRPIPNLPPEPTEIVVPTPPWVPNGGPYRTQ